ncbi:MAG: MMPL family transporter [Thermoleophilia bacterium]
MLAAIAGFSFRHRWLVLAVWIAMLAGINYWSQQAGSAFSFDFELPGSDSQGAMDILEERFPSRSGATGNLVFKADAGVDDPAVREQVAAISDRIARVPHVEAVVSPYSPEGIGQVSPEGRIARAVIQFDVSDVEISTELDTIAAIKEIVAGAGGEGVQFELGGDMFVDQPAIGAEGVGLTAAVFILLIAFGSVLAMGLPIITALFGIGIGLSIVTLLGHVISLPDFATQLAAMIGIGVGIDYALFIVTRYRQGLREELGPEQATVQAINTAGRSVIFAGVIVVISLLGMVLMNISFIQGLGIGAATVVLVTMLASVTLLPAVLGIVGRHIDRIRIPGLGRDAHRPEDSGLGYRWSQLLARRPWPAFIVGFVAVFTLAIPFFSMTLGSSDASSRSTSDTTRRAYDLEVEGFGPGSNGPLLLVASIDGAAGLEVLGRVQQAVAADSGVAAVTPPMPNEELTAAIMQVVPTTSPQDKGTLELIERLRQEVLPAAVPDGVEVHVGGITASFGDISSLLTERLPLFIGAVLAFSFVLLMVVFRSIAIPVKAVILNMLSIGAAYGVIVAVFQWGWGLELLGLGAPGPIESFLPMMLFAILFGLSMDYEVFLLSRIKEEYDRTGDNTVSIAHGLHRTARVITAAAAIMITVFGSFMLGDERVIKEFGFGLAVAILIDATIVRMLLVPSAMEIMGKANWWFPRWLAWLPEIHIDGNDVHVGENGEEATR